MMRSIWCQVFTDLGSRNLEIEFTEANSLGGLCYGDVCIPEGYDRLEPPFTEGGII